MIRISWSEPEDSPIKPKHISVLIAAWTLSEARCFADVLFGDGKIDISIEEIG